MTELKLALQGLRTGKWELVRGETSTPPPLPSLPSRPAAPPPPPPPPACVRPGEGASACRRRAEWLRRMG